METNEPREKIVCLKCRKLRVIDGNYYANKNPLVDGEHLPICRTCINKYIGDESSPNYRERVIYILAHINKPFLSSLWISSGEKWQSYITQIQSLSQYKDKTYFDSEFEKRVDGTTYSVEQVQLNEEELIEYQLQWGKGFEVDDYLFLENQFETLLNSYECDSYAQEMLFQEIAHQRLAIQKNREANKPTEKELKTLQDLLGSSNIKPVQETGANAAEQATFGTLIKKYENEHPIPEPDPEWADVDGIRKYVQVWFLGHLCRMLGIKNEYSKMYEEEIEKYKVEAPTYNEDEDGDET